MNENEDALDRVLEQLEADPEAVSKQFGKAPKFTGVNPPTARRTASHGSAYRPTEPAGPSRIGPYPNVYRLDADGEPVVWVGMFYNEDAAYRWVERQDGDFMVEVGAKRDLPAWKKETR